MSWLGPGIVASVALIVLGERALTARRGLPLGRWRSVSSNLGCGLLRATVALAAQGSLLAVYSAIHAHTALFRFDVASPLAWLVAFLGYDFAYYWVHRLSHRVPVLWAAHAVHHQATELEPSVLFRAPVIAPFQAFPLYALLAVLGVPAQMYLVLALVEHSLMFWLHTRAIGDAGLLGVVLNTPAHHRVHHAADASLGSSNYGGVLIVWDRLFGTFIADPGVKRFGIGDRSVPLGPIRANLAPWLELHGALARAPGARAKLAVLFGAERRQLLSRSRPLPGT